MIQTIFKEGLENKDFIKEKTEGMEELKKQISVFQPEFSEKTDACKDVIEKAARIFAQAKKSMILVGSGLWSHLDPKAIAIASSNLALVTGHMGKESRGILFLLEKCNSQGAIDMGLFSQGEGDGRTDLRRKALEGKLRALYLIGEDSFLASPAFDAQALEKTPLLIVQDLFMTKTAEKAHVVLPACAFVEKGGTFTNLERRVQRLNPLRPPLHQSRSDFDTFLALLRLLEGPVPGETPEAVFEEIGRTLPHYQGIQDGEQWPRGSTYLYADGFPKGKGKLIPIPAQTARQNSEGYSFHLIQRPSLFQSGVLSSRSDALKQVSEKLYLEMNPEDARHLNIETGEVAQVSTPQGRSLQMEVKYSSNLVSGIVTSPYPCPLVEEKGTAPIRVTRLKND
jgi:predicted molibdopterin-dependent oxidoreductase YjgC